MSRRHVVEDASHDCVGEVLDSFGVGVEGRIGGENGCSGEEEKLHVFYLNEVQWSFARDEDELFLLLKHDVRGAEKDIFAIAVSDAAIVPILHGITAMASQALEPLAKGAFMLLMLWVITPAGIFKPSGHSWAMTAWA